MSKKKLPKYKLINKRPGETPLQALNRLREREEWEKNIPLTYAGRLDPLASGLLLVLVGEECKKREKYLGLDKKYYFSILLGVGTDTGDVLGLVNNNQLSAKKYDDKEIEKVAKNLIGKKEFAYPAYSSRTVAGKPLFQWALEGRLGEIQIPTKKVNIYKLKHEATRKVSSEELHRAVHEKIGRITEVTEASKALGNDFRRVEVLESWHALMEAPNVPDNFVILKFSCTCSSGTYMRVLAQEIASNLGTTGLAFFIKRTKIGTYQRIIKQLGFWTKTYTEEV